MKKFILLISASIIMNFLTACSEKTQTVDWYLKHPEVLAKEIEKCKLKTLAELMTDKHCTVIKKAQKEEFDERQINAPLPNIEFK